VKSEGIEALTALLTGDDLHQRERAAESLRELIGAPSEAPLQVRWLVARRDWAGLRALESAAVPPLLEVLAESSSRTRERNREYERARRRSDVWRNQILDEMLVRTLGGIGDPRAAPAVIDFLFARSGLIGSAFEAERDDPGGWVGRCLTPPPPFWFGFRAGGSILASWVTALEPLLGDYSRLALESACYLPMSERVEGDRSDRGSAHYSYNHRPGDSAVEALCSLETARSSDLLFRVARKRRVKVPVEEGWNDYGGGISYEWVSFPAQKERARRALEARRARRSPANVWLASR